MVQRAYTAVAFLALTAPASPLQGFEDLAPARLVVDFAAVDGAPEWLARAFEGHAVRELTSFGRVTVVHRSDSGVACPDRDRDCLLRGYRKGGIDLVLLGSVTVDGLSLSAWETWTPRTLARGTLPFDANPTLPKTRHRLITMLSPIFSSGGWLDERPSLIRLRTPEPPSLPSKSTVRWVALTVLLLFATPLIVARFWQGKHRWGWAMAVIVGSALVLGTTFGDFSEWIDSVFGSATAGRVAAVAGGLAWGAFALTNLRILLPRLLGLERADHQALAPLLTAWVVAIAVRMIPLMLLYAPFALLAWAWAGPSLVAEDGVGFVLIPLGGLLILGWAAVAIDTGSLILDALLVRGAAIRDNKWHKSAERYFRGYIKRGGLAIPEALIDSLLILPTDRPLVTSYGGGLTHPRVLVPLDLLELALGEAPEDEDTPSRRYYELRHWRRGTVLPTLAPGDLMDTPQRRDTSTVATSIYAPSASNLPGHPQQDRLLGENATLLGLITPSVQGETVPLLSGGRKDYSIVRELLTSHYAGFLPREWNEEQDDTDPNQRDLLFGALFHEVGAILRGDIVWQTIGLLIEETAARAPAALRRLYAGVVQLLSPLGARSLRIIADAYPALNSGRDALIQYLYFRMTGDTEVLTARADSYRFESASKEILRRAALVEAGDLPPVAQRFRARLFGLNLYLRAAVQVPRRSWPRRVALTAVAALVLAGVAYSVIEATAYAPIYEDRMKQLNAQIAAREGQDDGTD